MLCKICKDGLEGIWDPERTKRVGLNSTEGGLASFPADEDGPGMSTSAQPTFTPAILT